MYVINQAKGIGEVIEVTDANVLVYFPEVDEEKSLMKAFVTIYNTLEDAENALSPEITDEVVNEIVANSEAEKQQSIEASRSARWLEQHNEEVSKKLMKNI